MRKVHSLRLKAEVSRLFVQLVSRSYAAVVLWTLILTACAPTSIPSPAKEPQTVKQKSSTTLEINNALATLSLKTSLPASDYEIGPEDLLQITLFNIREAEAMVTPRMVAVRVSHQGIIKLPLIGEMKAAGLTTARLEEDIRKRYERYINDPQIGVIVAEYRQRVSVIGAVQKTGVFPLSGPNTIIDILATAGGVTEKAGSQVHIYRQGPKGRESHVIDLLLLASNAALINAENAGLITMPVQAGDVINVPPAGMFFVDGAVRNPGPYPLGRRYTLTQALATAGGVDRELYASDVTIFRRTDAAGMQPISIDLDAVFAGSVSDPQIEADDVIAVPISGGKYFVKRFVGQFIAGGISLGSFIPAGGGS